MPASLPLQRWKIPPKSSFVIKSFKSKHTLKIYTNILHHPPPVSADQGYIRNPDHFPAAGGRGYGAMVVLSGDICGLSLE